MYSKLAAISALVAAAKAQQACTLTTETKPSLEWSTCTSAGSCTTNTGSIVIDANWRWVHDVNSSTNCYTGNTWDTSICDTDATCAEDCCLDGADYSSTYGVSSSGDALTLDFVTDNSNGENVGSRLYLMSSDTEYEMFTLLGKEFSFDVDVSQLPCGLNGALYFVSMPEDGGTSEYSGNKAGAAYGTGYCDSQCPRDLKFIGGQANVEGWVASTNNANTGLGDHGSCCPEMDVWEANSYSTAYTAHPCESITETICDGDACGGTYSGADNRYDGTCDPDGCDFNSYRNGDTTFYGDGKTVDTSQVFTVVTQFIESGGSLSEIRRYYVQNGELIPNSYGTVSGLTAYNSLTEAYCEAEITAFDSEGSFTSKGGWSGISEALAAPMVLVLSLWDDYYADMLWLDSTYPVGSTTPGSVRGSCSTSSGVPASVESSNPSSKVIYSNIKFGAINSTYTV
ncbi:family 7 glycoside hydrolase [Cryphonectria parasitica EP155]|uniref:Glucanase n=1 Tax=Cryphonectria parasitica (strain ATCC 38755 / EP155) TaxID=660469 RepID=A0A9P4Y6F5_CRYP1|nr:family 7 glycoside hydrolase [Cryphonectria parasitica EP155]KAF3767351.1 family 7 glycoside hydrolase [Cryphonectria parasitica EP155]